MRSLGPAGEVRGWAHEPATEGSGGTPGIRDAVPRVPHVAGVVRQVRRRAEGRRHPVGQRFPVENCLIVGTDLKQVERVTARLTWGRVALGGRCRASGWASSSGLILSLFSRRRARSRCCSHRPLRRLFGLVWSLVGYAFTRGARDFSSVSQVVATSYEVFSEHKFAQQGRQILADAGIDVGPAARRGHRRAPGSPPPPRRRRRRLHPSPPPLPEPGPPPRAH